jgi:hypothetical protein
MRCSPRRVRWKSLKDPFHHFPDSTFFLNKYPFLNLIENEVRSDGLASDFARQSLSVVRTLEPLTLSIEFAFSSQ